MIWLSDLTALAFTVRVKGPRAASWDNRIINNSVLFYFRPFYVRDTLQNEFTSIAAIS